MTTIKFPVKINSNFDVNMYKIEIFLTVDSYDSTSSCKTALLIPFTIIVYYIQLGQKEAGDIKIQMHALKEAAASALEIEKGKQFHKL